MNLDLTDDQRMLVDATRRFLRHDCPLAEVRRLHEEDNTFSSAYWRQGAELGWFSMLVPETLGGGSVSGRGLEDLALIAETMGQFVAPGPFAQANAAALAISRSGSDHQRASLLPAVMSGDVLLTWAFDDAGGAAPADRTTVSFRRKGESWILRGTAPFVQDPDVADLILVTASDAVGGPTALGQFIVDAQHPGVEQRRLDSIDLVRRYAAVEFHDVEVTADAVINEPGHANRDVDLQLETMLVLHGAETVGAINVVFEMTVEYALDRVAFGRPIGSYQALKHRFADMKTWLEACNATMDAAAVAVAAGSEDASELVHVATAYVAERAPAIVQDCIQIHGGIGVTWEHDLHLYLRRVTQNVVLHGGSHRHRQRIAELIGPD